MRTGEKVMKQGSKCLGRVGRAVVKVRVVGDHSFAWVEAGVLWGGNVGGLGPG